MKVRAMTPKQQRFVDEYLVSLNASDAAIRAGYSAKTAYSIGQENLSKPEIAKAIRAAMAKRMERTEVTQDYVLNSIVAIMEERKGVGEHSNPQAALKAAELLGRHLAMFTDKVENRHSYENLTDEELDARITELQREVGTSQRTH